MDGSQVEKLMAAVNNLVNRRLFGQRLWVFILVLTVFYAGFVIWRHEQPTASQYVTVPVRSGNIVRAIVATGTVNPVTMVQVGSYVSGTIQSLFCDYNTQVKAGQLCAKIDPRPYQVVYDQADANMANAVAQLQKDQASLTYAKLNYERDLGLRKQGIVSQDALDSDKNAFDQAQAQIAVDDATIKQRRAALDAARVNLDYTDIKSPVDGIVVSRSIDVGQTVAASFQTPTLFLIAKDLTQMQVDTNVNESDVSSAKIGQKALFNVEAYPDRTYEGKVKQVRQAPISVQNIVTYDVVISIDNPDFQLLPGMTANTRIISGERNNVLYVPIQALRFSMKGQEENVDTNAVRPAAQRVYVLREGKPQRVAVSVGMTDGVNAEISGNGIQAGDEVIVNEFKTGDVKTGAPQRSPLRF